MSVTMTYAAKSDADVLTDLQSLGLSVNVTGYTSSTGQIVFDSTPSEGDVETVEEYFDSNDQFDLS